MFCIRCKKDIMDNSVFCNYCGKKQTGVAPSNQKHRRRPKGTGSVYKISNGRSKPWAAYNKGIIGTYATSSEAVLALDSFNTKNNPVEIVKYTLEQVYSSFKETSRYQKLTPSGQEGLSVAWGRLDKLHKRVAASIRVTEYQEIIDNAMKAQRYKTLSKEELALKTENEQAHYKLLESQPIEPLGYDGKNRIKQLVSHLYNEMIRLEITAENKSNLLSLPTLEKSNKRNFTAAERELLFKNDNDDIVKIILIYVECGFRLNELLSLKKETVNLQERIFIGGSKSEAGTDRVIPIKASVLKYVEYFYNQSKCFLIEQNGKPISDTHFRKDLFYSKLDELGIERMENGKNVITPHRARHTFVANAVMAGVAPEALKAIAGHSKYTTTIDKYGTSLGAEYLHQELEKIK